MVDKSCSATAWDGIHGNDSNIMFISHLRSFFEHTCRWHESCGVTCQTGGASGADPHPREGKPIMSTSRLALLILTTTTTAVCGLPRSAEVTDATQHGKIEVPTPSSLQRAGHRSLQYSPSMDAN